MITKTVAALLAASALLAGPAMAGSANPQASDVTVIHAGRLLDRPGQAPRTAASLILRGDKVEAVRDGYVDLAAARHDFCQLG